MHAFTVNYAKDSQRHRGQVLHRGYFVHGVPRLVVACRLFGHRPVVDGTQATTGLRPEAGHRWVCCDRCGVRGEPQGSLDPSIPIGTRYNGPWAEPLPGREDSQTRTAALLDLKGRHTFPPGPVPKSSTGALGVDLVAGGGHGGPSFEAKVGNAGSEHTLAAHVTLGWLGGLYLHTERHGTWLQRRLNPTGYVSRVTGLSVHGGCLYWRVWADRDGSSKGVPRWRYGSVAISVRDRLLGQRRYAYQDEGEPVQAVVRLPHGDDHQVRLQLQRQTYGRARWRKKLAWTVDWHCKLGIPTKPGDRGHILGSAVDVSDTAVRQGSWPAEAAGAIALWATQARGRYGYTPPPEVDEVVV